MKVCVRFTVVFIITILYSHIGNSQLLSIGADTSVLTMYNVNNVNDSIYIYRVTDKNWDTQKGSLKVISIDTTSGWIFTYSVYNADSNKFLDPQILAGDSIDTIKNLETGCYAIRMQKDTVDSIFRAWIFLDKLRANVYKDKDGNLPYDMIRCEKLQIKAIRSKQEAKGDTTKTYFHEDKFYYENPADGEQYVLKNIVKTTVVSEDGTSNSVANTTTINMYDPPAKNTAYFFTVEDAFKNKVTDTVKYITINTKANFTIQVSYDTINYKDYIPNDSIEAPLYSYFKDSSLNAESYEWIVSDTVFNNEKVKYDTKDVKNHLYIRPYEYQVKLITYSPAPYSCVDTSEIKTVKLADSKFGESEDKAFPKFFEPGSTGKYNTFYPKADNDDWKSIRKLHLTIFNNWGHLVYKYEGPLKNSWKGWDGKSISGRDVEPGVYYYYYFAEGYGQFIDPVKKDAEGKPLKRGYSQRGKGYVYLFRKR